MAKNIEPKLKKIGDYLKLEEDTVFTIPEYQRAYSWGSRIATSCGKTSIIMLKAKAKTDTSLEQLSLTVRIMTPSTD